MDGVITFPIDIWDATKLEENKVSMDQTTFGQLCAFLAIIQNQAFETRKLCSVRAYTANSIDRT